MVRIAVTGGIACGKSQVGLVLAEEGVAVCEADVLAHAVMGAGTSVYEAVVKEFGDGILTTDGTIDRARLGEVVFGDADARERLNAVVHPAVVHAWRQWIEARPQSTAVCAVIIPLLYEIGAEKGWDAVICVACSCDLQRRRMAERGLSAHEADLRIAAQMPLAQKIARADYVIVNEGSRNLLRQQTLTILEEIMKEEEQE